LKKVEKTLKNVEKTLKKVEKVKRNYETKQKNGTFCVYVIKSVIGIVARSAYATNQQNWK
jgi:hypothetical protein